MGDRKAQYRLPKGGWTEDPDEYGKAWKELGEIAEKFFEGYEWTAFDPDIKLDRKDRYTNNPSWKRTSIELTVDAVLALRIPLGSTACDICSTLGCIGQCIG